MKRALYGVAYWAFWGAMYSAAIALCVTAFLAIGPLMSLFFEASEEPLASRILDFFDIWFGMSWIAAGAFALVAVVPAALTGVIQAILVQRGRIKRSDEIWIFVGAAAFSVLAYVYLQYGFSFGYSRNEWHWNGWDLVGAALFAMMGLFCSSLILGLDRSETGPSATGITRRS